MQQSAPVAGTHEVADARRAAGRHRPARAARTRPSSGLLWSRCSPRPAGRRCRRRNAGSSSAGLGVVTHAFVDGDHGEPAALDDDEYTVAAAKATVMLRRHGTRRRGAGCRRPARSPACRDSRASTRRNLTPFRARAVVEIRNGLAPAVDARAASRSWTPARKGPPPARGYGPSSPALTVASPTEARSARVSAA